MTLSLQEKIALSDVRMKRAREFRDDAADNLERGRYRTAVNRAYCAVMNAARSLLILEGVNPETHDGVVTMLSLHFVKKGLVSVEIVKTYKLLFSRRTDVDYGDFDAIDNSEATSSVQIATHALETLDSFRRTLIRR